MFRFMRPSCGKVAGRSPASRFAALLVSLWLAACGGGGGGGEATPPPAVSDGSTLAATTRLASAAQSSQVASVQALDDGRAALHFPAGASLPGAVVVGGQLLLPPGADPRFPLGLGGKVDAVEAQPDGGSRIVLSPTKVAEAMPNSRVSLGAQPLDESNFIGVISPSQVQSLSLSVGGRRTVLSHGQPVAVPPREQALANGPVSLGDISLSGSIKLSELATPFEGQSPIAADAKVTLSGKISNLKLTRDHDWETVANIPTKLKSLNLRVTGDVQASVAFEGQFSVTLGPYTNAWKDVSEKHFDKLGVKGSLSGLDSKDKIGKFPVAGLIFAATCPSLTGCPVRPGATDDALRMASTGGVIVWVYLTTRGELTLDGSTGVRLNAGALDMGMTKPEGGSLDGVFTLKPKQAGNLLEAPFIQGKVNFQARAGIELEADLFTFGIWTGSVGAFYGTQFNAGLTAEPALVYGTPSLSGPWAWDGQACLSYSIGGGGLYHARLSVGASVETSWKTLSGSFVYGGDWPNPADIPQEGWHRIAGLPSWLTTNGRTECFPKPSVSDISPRVAYEGVPTTFTVTANHLPTDKSIVFNFGDAGTTCREPTNITSQGFRITCTPQGGAGPRQPSVSIEGTTLPGSLGVDVQAATGEAPVLLSLAFTPEGEGGRLKAVFDRDMRPTWYTTGYYTVAPGGNLWPDVRTYELVLSSYQPGKDIIFHGEGFVSTEGMRVVGDRTFTFPGVANPPGSYVAPPGVNVLQGRWVSDSNAVACGDCGQLTSVTDGNPSSSYLLLTRTGHLAVFLDQATTLDRVAFTPRLDAPGQLTLEIRTSPDAAASLGTFTTQRVATYLADDRSRIEVIFTAPVENVRVVQVIIRESPASRTGTYEIEAYSSR